MNIPIDISDNQTQQQSISTNEIEKRKEEREKLIRMNQERIKIEAIKMVCRQTDYNEKTAKEKMEKANYNYEMVLNEYYGITEKTTNKIKNNLSTNQIMYGEIRNLMDVGSRNFRLNQEGSDK